MAAAQSTVARSSVAAVKTQIAAGGGRERESKVGGKREEEAGSLVLSLNRLEEWWVAAQNARAALTPRPTWAPNGREEDEGGGDADRGAHPSVRERDSEKGAKIGSRPIEIGRSTMN